MSGIVKLLCKCACWILRSSKEGSVVGTGLWGVGVVFGFSNWEEGANELGVVWCVLLMLFAIGGLLESINHTHEMWTTVPLTFSPPEGCKIDETFEVQLPSGKTETVTCDNESGKPVTIRVKHIDAVHTSNPGESNAQLFEDPSIEAGTTVDTSQPQAQPMMAIVDQGAVPVEPIQTLASWLQNHGLAEYQEALHEIGVSRYQDLILLDDNDISGLNMKPIHQKKLLRAIDILKTEKMVVSC